MRFQKKRSDARRRPLSPPSAGEELSTFNREDSFRFPPLLLELRIAIC